MPRQKHWTTVELRRASVLWNDGKSIDEICEAIGRRRESLKHQIEHHRDLFPRRRQARKEMLDTVDVKFKLSKFLHREIAKEAKRRNISMAMIVRETLRTRFIAKRSFDDGNGRETRRSGERSLQETVREQETFLS